MNHTLNPDLYVSPSRSITAKTFRVPAGMGDELRAVEGVGEVQAVRNERVMIDGQPVMAVALDIGEVARRIAIRPVEGDREEMVRLGAQSRYLRQPLLTISSGRHLNPFHAYCTAGSAHHRYSINRTFLIAANSINYWGIVNLPIPSNQHDKTR
jgi:hypothetical protein